MIRTLLLIFSIQSAVYGVGQQEAGHEVLLMREPQLRAMVRFQILPKYPAKALRLSAQGVVVSEMHFDKQGVVTKVEIVESANNLFNDPTIRALKQWRFRPVVTPNGKVFGGRSKITFYFYYANGHGWVEDPLIFKNKKAVPIKSAQARIGNQVVRRRV
jgi:TonB family protein